ncbi:hypothetical protein JIX56_07490 [Streptomyces sp. CA-210063]|uniref:hypothetical protein n=1 Tax=Streptomyces sp. CA-210063 TaxID=2801029 RepID=UPI00214B2454|nr:hypothetical protein [Streptomyces sp. CA-210063]UUU29742.1 hypothetical protein JIX56_07490 [Streptomyces sp. CA-210063]
MRLSVLELLLDRVGPWAAAYFGPAQGDEWRAKRREVFVREACRTLEEEGADTATTQAVPDAPTDISPAEDPAGRAIFVAGGEALSCRLSRPPQGQIACWAPLPRLAPLLERCGQDPVCPVTYVDRTGADFADRFPPDGDCADVPGVVSARCSAGRTSPPLSDEPTAV